MEKYFLTKILSTFSSLKIILYSIIHSLIKAMLLRSSIGHAFHRWSIITGTSSYSLSVLCIRVQMAPEMTHPRFWTCCLWSLNYLFCCLQAFCSFCVKCIRIFSYLSSLTLKFIVRCLDRRESPRNRKYVSTWTLFISNCLHVGLACFTLAEIRSFVFLIFMQSFPFLAQYLI